MLDLKPCPSGHLTIQLYSSEYEGDHYAPWANIECTHPLCNWSVFSQCTTEQEAIESAKIKWNTRK